MSVVLGGLATAAPDAFISRRLLLHEAMRLDVSLCKLTLLDIQSF